MSNEPFYFEMDGKKVYLEDQAVCKCDDLPHFPNPDCLVHGAGDYTPKRALRPWHDKCVCPSPCEPHGTIPTEITIGPYFFEWSEKNSEMYIGYGEEVQAMVETCTAERWAEFVRAYMKGSNG